jgi:hypothetical protein
MTELHSLAPWFLARYQPSLERTARENLTVAGYENWYPSFVDFRPMPLRKIPPKKRHLAQWFVQEVRRPRFVGYILIRPLPWCPCDVNRLFDLTGCGSIVAIGGVPAKIQDFDVELMRLAEARGKFDTYSGAAFGRYRISHIDRNLNPWVAQGKKLLNLDEARNLRLLIDALGRIATVISAAEEPEIAFSKGVPTGVTRNAKL